MRSHWAILLAMLAASDVLAAAPRWVDVTAQPTVTRREVQWAVASLVAGRSAPADDAGMVALLRGRRLLRGSELERPEAHATRGYASLLFARALGEKASTMRLLLKNSERYAYRHLEYLRLVPPGGASHRISGGELVSLLGLSRKRLGGREVQ